jgi:hypothetical protein
MVAKRLSKFIGRKRLVIWPLKRFNEVKKCLDPKFQFNQINLDKDVHFFKYEIEEYTIGHNIAQSCTHEIYSKGQAVAQVLALKDWLRWLGPLSKTWSGEQFFNLIYLTLKKIKKIYNCCVYRFECDL